MNAEAIKRHADAAVLAAEKRLQTPSARLRQFDSEIAPAVQDMVKWERLGKDDTILVLSHLTVLRTRIVNHKAEVERQAEEAKHEREKARHGPH